MEQILDIIPAYSIPFSVGIIVIIVGYIKLWKLRKAEYPELIGIFGIWLMGIIALLLGILGQFLATMRTFDIIQKAGDINASLIAGGMKIAYNSTLTGLVVLIISLIIWGILRGVKDKKVILNRIQKEND